MLKKFYEEEGRLPLSGGIPDMISKSTSYLALQNLYQDKAKSDRANMTERLAKEFTEKSDFEKYFDEDEFIRFVKNCKQL